MSVYKKIIKLGAVLLLIVSDVSFGMFRGNRFINSALEGTPNNKQALGQTPAALAVPKVRITPEQIAQMQNEFGRDLSWQNRWNALSQYQQQYSIDQSRLRVSKYNPLAIYDYSGPGEKKVEFFRRPQRSAVAKGTTAQQPSGLGRMRIVKSEPKNEVVLDLFNRLSDDVVRVESETQALAKAIESKSQAGSGAHSVSAAQAEEKATKSDEKTGSSTDISSIADIDMDIKEEFESFFKRLYKRITIFIVGLLSIILEQRFKIESILKKIKDDVKVIEIDLKSKQELREDLGRQSRELENHLKRLTVIHTAITIIISLCQYVLNYLNVTIGSINTETLNVGIGYIPQVAEFLLLDKTKKQYALLQKELMEKDKEILSLKQDILLLQRLCPKKAL